MAHDSQMIRPELALNNRPPQNRSIQRGGMAVPLNGSGCTNGNGECPVVWGGKPPRGDKKGENPVTYYHIGRILKSENFFVFLDALQSKSGRFFVPTRPIPHTLIV